MANNQDDQPVQKTAEEIQAEFEAYKTTKEAELVDLKTKADASSQNFERAKKAEEELKELKKIDKPGESQKFDSAALKKDIEDRVSLRLAGHSPEEIEEIEAFAKGKGISLSEAANSPFVKKAVDAIRAEKKNDDSTPNPSSKIKVFNGKPVTEVLKSGSKEDKQSAFESMMKKGGSKGNE